MATKPKTSTKASAIKEEEVSKVRFKTLVINDVKYKTLLTEKFKNREKWEEPNLKKILSQIPGTVIKVYVEEGQKVKEGDLMMVLEAMKMKNKIYFPIDGTVKKIYVTENEKVPKKHLMVELK
ncbi:MAG: biotin/lipoyl-binding protein [Bacteroidales bacterium]|nr:biotin/lipoyl-binding protein [Bacteroidales bacterium]